MAVVKSFKLQNEDLAGSDELTIDITEGPVTFWKHGTFACYATDVDAIDKLQKALAVWVAWKRLSDDA